jgi:APA family basic amino acid/polyamine antiporter
MIGIASMIGGSIFNLVGPAMHDGGPSLLIVFLASGVISLFTALTYAELGSAFPEAGGGYRWVREGLPRPNAFISGWIAWFAHMIAGSLYAVSIGDFVGSLLTSIGVAAQYGGIPLEKIIATLSIIIFTYVNYRGVSLTGKVGNGLTFIQIVIIIILITSGIYAMGFVNHNWATNFQHFVPKGITGFILAMGITFIAFEGYEIIVQAGEEVKNPRKNIPKAIFITLGVVTSLYIVFTFVFIGGIDASKVGKETWQFIGDNRDVGIAKAAEYLIPYGTVLVFVGGIVSSVAALSATTFSSSRVAFAMGRQYNLPYIFSSIHSRHHTPHFAIIASGFIMLIMASWLPLEQIALVAGVMFLFLFTQVNWAGINIRRLYGHKLDYGFKIPLFPLMPIIGIICKAGLAIFLLVYNPLSWVIAIIWILMGFSVYKLYISKKEIEHYAPLVANIGPVERKNYRIMVVFNKKTIEKLAKIASIIAKDKDGEISLLNVVTIPLQIPLSMGHRFAEPIMKSFDNLKNQEGFSEYRYLVRLSHDNTEAILATAEEQGINLLIMDFFDLKNNRKLLSLATCDILGVSIKKEFESELSNVVVSYDKGRHSDLGIEIAHAFFKIFGSKIRIIRGVVESPEEERDILSRINEKMFDLDLKKIPVERVYPTSSEITKDILDNLNRDPEIVIVGAGNQSEQAFSPTTMEIVDKSRYSVFIVRDSRFASIKARYFWHVIAPRLKENRIIYRIYRSIYKLRPRKKMVSDEEYFSPKI